MIHKEWPNYLYVCPDSEPASLESADENLAFYRDLLIAEANYGFIDPRSRQDFLVAVGARALMNGEYRPQQVAGEAFHSVHSRLLIESQDTEMPYWTKSEWEQKVRNAFEAFVPREHEYAPLDDSYSGYLEVVTQLRRRSSYPLRRTGTTGNPRDQRYHFEKYKRRWAAHIRYLTSDSAKVGAD